MIFHEGHKNPHKLAVVSCNAPRGGKRDFSEVESSIAFNSKWSISCTVKLLQSIYRIKKSHSWVIKTLNDVYGVHNWFSEVTEITTTPLEVPDKLKVRVKMAITLADETCVEESVEVIGGYKKVKHEASRRALRGCLFKLIELYELTIEGGEV